MLNLQVKMRFHLSNQRPLVWREFIPEGDSMKYNINATGIAGITAGHIHIGKQGENGKVVVALFKFDSAKDVVSENGVINTTALEGPLKGKQIFDLESLMTNGTAYANIHTEKNPNGEIRGQIANSNSTY